ncbi:zinc-binding dehydrogenase [Aeromicrobium sp. Leaf350]|uniref:zinc-binding dehydrogenase n=1 Tax=Aeromicrobium sp. Leaf350 TaxID=2876565 RepID=UPI001E4CEB45|nr:zinc-binding dehydrogenase [Aeromicrobium sp. Leaf350]
MTSLVEPAPSTTVRLDPPATAMSWVEPGRRHVPFEVDRVALADGEVLVEIELATICGSDVHTTRGDRSGPAPSVLGHEYVGRVQAIEGRVSTVSGDPVRIGDRVVWSIMASCHTCDRCRRGLPQKCRSLLKYGHERITPTWQLNGGFATHAHLRAGTAIVAVGEDLPGAVLVPASCGTATAQAAVERAAAVVDLAGSVVLVSGAGLIGLTASAMATDRGARVIVSDPDRRRRELALDFGAERVVDPADSPCLAEAVRTLGATEIDIALEASGAPSAVTAAIKAVGVGGVVVLVGSVFPTPPVPLDPESVVRRLVTVTGVHNYAPAHLHAAVTFLEDRATHYPFAALVGPPRPLADLDRALAAAGRAEAVRVAIDPRG